MKIFKNTINFETIIKISGGEWLGPKLNDLKSVCEPSEAVEHSIIFCEQERLVNQVQSSRAGLIVTSKAFSSHFPERSLLIVEKPYLSFMSLVSYWLSLDDAKAEYLQNPEHGGLYVDPSATVDSTVTFEGKAYIGANVVIKANCTIGDKAYIEANSCLAEGVQIGANTRIYTNVTIYDDCTIGKDCIIHSGVVIGADGFGFLLADGRQQKIPQVGIVEIHDSVEIGANSTIDRATLGATVIKEGAKIDNLVQIGHNCVVGKHSILCAQVGLAGSTIVGDYVYLAGQVGAAGHITIGSKAMVGAQSGIAASIPEGARYFGTPAMDANQMKRLIVAQKSLPEIYRAYQKTLKGEKK